VGRLAGKTIGANLKTFLGEIAFILLQAARAPLGPKDEERAGKQKKRAKRYLQFIRNYPNRQKAVQQNADNDSEKVNRVRIRQNMVHAFFLHRFEVKLRAALEA